MGAGRIRPPRGRGVWGALAAVGLAVIPTPMVGRVLAVNDAPGLELTLGATPLSVQGAALVGLSRFDLGPQGMAVQTASATAHNPYREVTITEIPYGAADQDDPALGLSYPGSAPGARRGLQSFRLSQGASPLGHPSASIFGVDVQGDANLVSLDVDGPTPVPTVVAEWVSEARGALWLVRTVHQVPPATGPGAGASLLPSVSEITVGVAAVTGTQGAAFIPITTAPAVVDGAQAPPPPVPTPSWWSGTCDTNNYSAAALNLTGRAIPAYPLSAGAVWDGLTACGPRPYYNEGPDVSVHFPGAGWSVLEWECVELSMRWMYLAWNVDPYPANGSGVVWNYSSFKGSYNPSGPPLQAIANNGNGPMPVPGDVLSYGATSSAGHTSVVTSTSIDSNGNGTVTVLEENASSTGWDTVSVSNWVLGGFDGGVTGWLHNPAVRGATGARPLPAAPGGSRALPPV